MYYSDEPITKPEEDAFGRDVFVKNLVDDINQWQGGGSLVLALYGPWGTGKSSVLKLVQNKIERDKTSEIILFDPWYFNSTEQLIQTFFSVVQNKILPYAVNEETKKSLVDAFKRYSSTLSQFVSWEPTIELPGGFKVNLGGIRKNKPELENPEKVRADLRQALSKIDRKFIVLIDNLDRLDPPELMLMFKLVRLCSDFPNFVFILAFDRKQVRNLILDRSIDPEFLAKIIQIDIELPLIDQEDIDKFIENNLRSMVEKLGFLLRSTSWDRFAGIYNKCMGANLINDLRKAKRYLNSTGFTLSLLKEDVDLADFLVLEAIRVFYPAIYSGLPRYKKELTTFEFGLNAMRNLRLNSLKEFGEWISKELSIRADVQICEQLIGFLFPSVGAFFDNPLNPTIITRDDEYMASQRVCVPDYFDTYFKFRLPKGEMPLQTINLIEDCLNQQEYAATVNIHELILSEKDRFQQLLSKLYYRVENINLEGRITLIKELGELGNILEWELLNSWNSSGTLASRIAFKCIESIQDNSVVVSAIQEVIASTSSLAFACEIINRIFGDRFSQVAQHQKDSLKSTVLERIHRELLQGNLNIFVAYPTSYYRIIGIWRSEKILNEKEVVNKYVYDQVSRDANALPKLLITFAVYTLGDNQVHEFRFDELGKEYDVNKLFEILKIQETSTEYSSIERNTIEAFKKYMVKDGSNLAN